MTMKCLCLITLILLNVNSLTVNSPSVEDGFKQCLISQPSSGFGYCLGVGAINKLQSLDADTEFDLIDGITLTRDQQQYREVHNFADRDPADFRSILDSFNYVFAQRSLRWDMGYLYPGLTMRVAPSSNPGGILEFVLDPHREALNAHSLKEAGTGRLLARQFLLPFLLGFKFNIATIIPVIFGLLALVAKKAIILSKIALIVSSAYGLGTLLLGTGNKHQANFHNSQPFNPAFGGHYNRFPEEEYQDVLYRSTSGNSVDQLRLYSNLPEAFDREDKSKGRNFAWNEAEKEKKNT